MSVLWNDELTTECLYAFVPAFVVAFASASVRLRHCPCPLSMSLCLSLPLGNWRRYGQHNPITELWLATVHINWKQTLVRTYMRALVILLMSNEYQTKDAMMPTYRKQTLVRAYMRVFVILLMSNEYQSERTRIPTYKNTKWLNKQCPTHHTNTTHRQTQTATQKHKHPWNCLMWNLLLDTTTSNTRHTN